MKAAEKLLMRMRKSQGGWGADHFATLYSGFGFTAREGHKHTIYIHEDYPELRASVARHKELANGYAEHAISVIDKLKELQSKEKEAKNGT